MFQQIHPSEAVVNKDLVVLSNSMVVNDEQVLELKEKATSWDKITKLVPTFNQEMLVIADLMYTIDLFLVDKLNAIMAKMNLAQVEHVVQAIYRLSDKYRSNEEKQETNLALKSCIMGVGGVDEGTASAVMDQWAKCWKWTRIWVSFAHPLQAAGLEDLQILKSQIQVEAIYSEIKEAATFMVDLMIKMKTFE